MSNKRFMRMTRAEDGDGAGSGGVMTFVASTAGEKRDGLVIDQSKWDVRAFEANPVVLLNHDYSSLPLGRAAVRIEDGRMMTDVTWDEDDARAMEVKGKYERGFLNAVSVGWRDTEDGHELLDISAVAVPGDPDALMERTRAWAREILNDGDNADATTADEPADAGGDDDERPTRETWDEIAARMVAVYDVPGGADDDARLAAHKALRPLYRKWDRVPPEFLPAIDVADMDSQEWRALFLHDELDVTGYRAGKVLSRANEKKLRAAADAIMEVLRSAGVDDETERAAPVETIDAPPETVPAWMRAAASILGE